MRRPPLSPFELLQKPEITRVFALSGAERSARKADQLAALRERHEGCHRFTAWYADAGDQDYHILSKPLCDRLRLIFFGNFHQDWSEFVLSNLGIYRYEKVEFSPAARGFRSRRDIDDYLRITVENRGSDLHLSVGAPPAARIHGSLVPLEDFMLTPEASRDG